MEITLPYKFEPRGYQLPVFNALDSGILRLVLVWHRRSGKDLTAFNLVIKKAFERVGTYFYFLPTYKQGRKIIWDGMDKNGRPFLSYVPKQLLKGEPNGTFMQIKLVNGSIIQVIGTDDIDSVVGTNPIGAVFSEYSLQNPQAWDFVRPILVENGGWALFNYTPRGLNHGYDLYEMAQTNESWFTQRLTIEDTGGIVTQQMIEDERKAGMPEELIQQEFYCSFEASLVGSYYGKNIEKAIAEKRDGNFPYDPNLAVHTFWDLGVGDATAIIFAQRHNNNWAVIDYYENSGEGLPHYKTVLDEKKYNYGTHWAPFDITVKELGTGKTRIETARELGINFRIAPRYGIDDGINAVRQMFPTLYFNHSTTARLVRAAKEYHKEWDEERHCFASKPFHDWTSHPMDALRYMALSIKGIASYDELANIAQPVFSPPSY